MSKTRKEHREMLLEPARWPMWPWLPVKRTANGDYEHGLVYADDTEEGKPVRVWPFIRYEPKAWVLITNGHGDELAEMVAKAGHGNVIDFIDVDGLLDAGWVVD